VQHVPDHAPAFGIRNNNWYPNEFQQWCRDLVRRKKHGPGRASLGAVEQRIGHFSGITLGEKLAWVGNGDNFGLGKIQKCTIQPIVMYNFPNKPGLYLGYNNAITFNPKATSGNEWQIPLGLTFGRTTMLKNGDGLDLSIGAYSLAKGVDGGHDA